MSSPSIVWYPVMNKSDTISIDLNREMVSDLFITGYHTIDGELIFKTIFQLVMNYQSVNDVLFRSKQTNVEPVKIKKILFLLFVFRIITIKYRPDDNDILFNLGKS